MSRPSLSHHPDAVVLRELTASFERECRCSAQVLAWLGEADARRLYLPEGYPSMFAWCVGARNLSEDAAAKRIHAARAAREHPALLAAVAEGTLHLSAVVLLAPHLSQENAAELIAAASRKSKAQIERLLAERSSPPAPASEAAPGADRQAPGHVILRFAAPAAARAAAPDELALVGAGAVAGDPTLPPPGPAHAHAPGHVHVHARLTPLAGERFRLETTLDRELCELLCEARDLLGHAVPSGNLAEVLGYCLRQTVTSLRRRRCGAAARPRVGRAASRNARHIPARVRREVWARDGGRCTFVGNTGHRCEARRALEFDHEVPVARGGGSTAANLRLRCRAHNQYAAEQAFGSAFMHARREQARQRAAEARAARERTAALARTAREEAAARARQEREQAAAERQQQEELVPWLRRLGFRPAEAKGAAARCVAIADRPLEARVKHALSLLAPPCTRLRPGRPPASPP